MAHHHLLVRQRKKIGDRIIRQRGAFDGEQQLGTAARPIGAGDVALGPILRKRAPIAGEKLLIGRGVLVGDRELELKFGAARNADLFADEPVRLRGQFHGRSGERGRRSELLHEQDFVVITVNLDITGLLQFERNRPLDFADFPVRRQIPFDLRGQARRRRGTSNRYANGAPCAEAPRP